MLDPVWHNLNASVVQRAVAPQEVSDIMPRAYAWAKHSHLLQLCASADLVRSGNELTVNDRHDTQVSGRCKASVELRGFIQTSY